jgi:hypothetical protein
MPHKPKPNAKWDDPEESKRFIDTAEEIGATDEKTLERALKKIVLSKKQKKAS